MIGSIKMLTARTRSGEGSTYLRVRGGAWVMLEADWWESSIVCKHCGGIAPIRGYLKKNLKPRYFSKCQRCGHVEPV